MDRGSKDPRDGVLSLAFACGGALVGLKGDVRGSVVIVVYPDIVGLQLRTGVEGIDGLYGPGGAALGLVSERADLRDPR